MKQKKGFTLIELLAVIVILAIIALIATPIVLNTVKKTTKGASERGAENYISAGETAVAASLLGEDKIEDGLYTINSDGNITKDDKTYTIEVSGDKPTRGIVRIVNGQVVKSSQTMLTMGDYQVTYNSNNKIVASESSTSKACTVVDKNDDEINVGDVIKCGSEQFRVMSYDSDSETITLLAEYNLKVGRIYTSQTEYTEISTTEDGYGLQNSEMIGWTSSNNPPKGAIVFSDSAYWNSTTSTYPAYVYDENSNLYQYVEDYETYLKGNGVSTAEASLMSYDQAVALGCKNALSNACSSAPKWVYSTSYWVGSASNSEAIYSLYHGGNMFFAIDYSNTSPGRGIRPVVTISVNEI